MVLHLTPAMREILNNFGVVMSEVKKNKDGAKAALFAFDAAYRVCVMGAILAIILLLLPYAEKSATEYYFSFAIVGSLWLYAVVAPLGHSHLGADLRGLIVWALLFEIFYATIYTFDVFLPIYRSTRIYFNYADYGFLMLFIGRCAWFVRDADGLPLSFPKCEFVRWLVGGKSSHNKLTTMQKIGGYSLMIGSFAIGCVLQYYKVQFVVPAVAAFFSVFVMILLRHEEVNYKDLLDAAE
jgi:hypothetical protein